MNFQYEYGCVVSRVCWLISNLMPQIANKLRVNMRNTILLGILMLLLSNCQRPTDIQTVYTLDQKPSSEYANRLEEIISDVYVVPLETNDECLIDYYISSQFTPDMIYLLEGSSKQMFCFDLDGKFVKKFGDRGKGPGEYSSTNGMVVNYEKGELLPSTFGQLL